MTNSAGAGAGAVYNIMNGDMDKAGDKFDYIIDSLTDANPDDDSVLTISANIARNASQAAGKGAVEGAADLINDVADSLGGYSSNGLGDGWDKAADVGEGVGKFVRGTARGIAPEAIKEGFDLGVGSLAEKFSERPVLITGMALAAAPLLIPGIGGAYAKNLVSLAGGAIDMVPRGFKALTGGVSAMASGLIDGGKQVGNSIVTSPSKRGTAASRRRSRRR